MCVNLLLTYQTLNNVSLLTGPWYAPTTPRLSRSREYRYQRGTRVSFWSKGSNGRGPPQYTDPEQSFHCPQCGPCSINSCLHGRAERERGRRSTYLSGPPRSPPCRWSTVFGPRNLGNVCIGSQPCRTLSTGKATGGGSWEGLISPDTTLVMYLVTQICGY